jgi:hypothetical protein
MIIFIHNIPILTINFDLDSSNIILFLLWFIFRMYHGNSLVSFFQVLKFLSYVILLILSRYLIMANFPLISIFDDKISLRKYLDS